MWKKHTLEKYFKYIKYISIFITIIYLCLNSTARSLMSRYIEIYELNSKIEFSKQSISERTKRLYHLKNSPSHLDRITKAELGYVAEGEVEYRFQQPQKEVSNEI